MFKIEVELLWSTEKNTGFIFNLLPTKPYKLYYTNTNSIWPKMSWRVHKNECCA